MENNQQPKPKHQAGKGSKPRNNFSKKFRDGYDEISWKCKSTSKEGCSSCSTEFFPNDYPASSE